MGKSKITLFSKAQVKHFNFYFIHLSWHIGWCSIWSWAVKMEKMLDVWWTIQMHSPYYGEWGNLNKYREILLLYWPQPVIKMCSKWSGNLYIWLMTSTLALIQKKIWWTFTLHYISLYKWDIIAGNSQRYLEIFGQGILNKHMS